MSVTRQTFKNLASNFVNSTFADFTKTFVIEQLVETSDGAGGYTVAWTTFATVTGFVQRKSGGETIENDKIDEDYPTVFSFEFIPGVLNNMRIFYNGKYFNIRSIVPIQDVDVWLDITADEGDAT